MTKDIRIAWTVAAILGVVVIILLGIMAYGWYERQNNLGYVLEEGQAEIIGQRNSIREKCSGAEGAASEECQAAIQQLANSLAAFGSELSQIQRATSTDANIGGQ